MALVEGQDVLGKHCNYLHLTSIKLHNGYKGVLLLMMRSKRRRKVHNSVRGNARIYSSSACLSFGASALNAVELRSGSQRLLEFAWHTSLPASA